MEKTIAVKVWKTGKGTRASYDAARNARHACTMLVKKPTRRSTRTLTPSLQKSTALLTSYKERMLMLLVTNQFRKLQERCQ